MSINIYTPNELYNIVSKMVGYSITDVHWTDHCIVEELEEAVVKYELNMDDQEQQDFDNKVLKATLDFDDDFAHLIEDGNEEDRSDLINSLTKEICKDLSEYLSEDIEYYY